MLCVASWYQLINSEEYINYKMSKIQSYESSKNICSIPKGDTDGKNSKLFILLFIAFLLAFYHA